MLKFVKNDAGTDVAGCWRHMLGFWVRGVGWFIGIGIILSPMRSNRPMGVIRDS